MKRFDDVIEVGHLPTPKLVEEISFDVLKDRQIAEYKRLWPEWEDETEYEPVRAHLGVDAYSEELIRRRINEAASASHLALSTGADLDIKGEARLVKRKLITPGNPNSFPPIEPVYELDDEYRRRIQLAVESWSVAGPEGAYVFWGMLPETSYDVVAESPSPADALITIMGRNGGGAVNQEEIDNVDEAIDQKTRVPFTDRVTYRSVREVEKTWDAVLHVKRGADPEVVLAEARKRAAAYVSYLKYIGRSATPVGAYGALAVPGVEKAIHNLSDGHIVDVDQVLYFRELNFSFEVVE